MSTDLIFNDQEAPLPFDISHFQLLLEVLFSVDDPEEPMSLHYNLAQFRDYQDFMDSPFDIGSFRQEFLDMALFLVDDRLESLKGHLRQAAFEGQLDLNEIRPGLLNRIFYTPDKKTWSSPEIAKLLEQKMFRKNWAQLYRDFPLEEEDGWPLLLISAAYKIPLDQFKLFSVPENLDESALEFYDPEYLFWAVAHGLFKVIKYLIKRFDLTLVDFRYRNNQLLINLASQGQLKILKYLDQQFDYKFNRYDAIAQANAAFIQAARHNHLDMLQFLTSRFNITSRDVQVDQDLLLDSAIFHNNLEMVEFLLDDFALPLGKRKPGEDLSLQIISSLAYAAKKGYLEMIKYVYQEFDLTIEDIRREENEALKLAIRYNRWKVIRYLIEDLGLGLEDLRDQNGLIILALIKRWRFNPRKKQSYLKKFQYLVERLGLTSDDVRIYDNTPLINAAAGGSLDLVRYLVEEFNLTLEDVRSQNNDALIKAISRNHLEVAHYLVEKFDLTPFDAQAQNNEALISAAKRGLLEAVQYVVTRFSLGRLVMERLYFKPFSQAARYGQFEMVKYLADHFKITRTDLQSQNYDALTQAVFSGQLDLVQYIAEEFRLTPADLRSQNGKALRFAIIRGYLDIARYLINYFDVRQNETFNWIDRFLWPLTTKSSLEMIQFLSQDLGIIANDFRPGLLNKIIELLISYGQLEKIQALVTEFNLSFNNEFLAIYIMASAEKGTLDTLRYFVENFNVNRQTFTNLYQLILNLEIIARRGNLEMAQYWISRFQITSAEVEQSAPNILAEAARGGNLRMVYYLSEHFNLSQTYARRQGNDTLHAAIHSGNYEMVKYLIEHFGLTLIDIRGSLQNNDSLHMAATSGVVKVIQYLVEYFDLTWEDLGDQSHNVLEKVIEGGFLPAVIYLVEYFKLTAQYLLDLEAHSNLNLEEVTIAHPSVMVYLKDQVLNRH